MQITKEQSTYFSDTGVLIISFKPLLDVELKIDPWDKGLKWCRLKNNEWKPERGDLGIALLDHDSKDFTDFPAYRFIQRIPVEIKKRLQPFIYCQFAMLDIVSKNRDAYDLLISNPVLLWLLVVHAEEKQETTDNINKVLKLKQLDILEFLFGIREKSMLKFLKKIKSKKYTTNELRIIDYAIRTEEIVHSLKHQPEIFPIKIALMKNYLDLRHYGFFDEFCRQALDTDSEFVMEVCEVRNSVEDIYRMGQELNIQNIQAVLKNCKTIGALQGIHDRWMGRLNKRGIIQMDGKFVSINKAFPSPPILGNDNIKPIDSYKKLERESRMMHHCVSGYTREILRGECYIYSIQYPERGTIELKMHCGEIFIGQFKLKNNANPSIESKLLVSEWILGTPRKKPVLRPNKTL